MKLQLTKAQISELYLLLRKHGRDDTDLYAELHDLLRLHPHIPDSKTMEITIDDSDLDMVHGILTPPERD